MSCYNSCPFFSSLFYFFVSLHVTTALRYSVLDIRKCKLSHPFLSRKQSWTAVLAEELRSVMHERIVVVRFIQRGDVVYLHEVEALT